MRACHPHGAYRVEGGRPRPIIVERELACFPPRRKAFGPHVRARGGALRELGMRLRSGLEGDDTAARSNADRGEQREVAEVRADIEEGHALFQGEIEIARQALSKVPVRNT